MQEMSLIQVPTYLIPQIPIDISSILIAVENSVLNVVNFLSSMKNLIDVITIYQCVLMNKRKWRKYWGGADEICKFIEEISAQLFTNYNMFNSLTVSTI
jgi:hypothetical protein